MSRPRIENRRDRIMDAAHALLVVDGWKSATVADIAREAGIGKGAIYLEFADKQSILDAVLRRSMRSMVQHVRQGAGDNGSVTTLAGVYRTSCEALLADPLMRALFSMDSGILGAHVTSVKDNRYFERLSFSGDYVKALQDANVLSRDVDPHTLTLVLSIFTVGLIHASSTLGSLSDAELTSALSFFAEMVESRCRSNSPVDSRLANAAHSMLITRLDEQLTQLDDRVDFDV